MKRRICLLLSGLLAAAVLCLCACAAGTSETAPSETEAATAQSDTSAAKTEAAESKGSQRDESAVRVIWQPDENTERQTLKAKSPKPLQAAENPPVVELVSPYTYQMLETDLALLHKIYPAHFSYTSLGKTADGRQIYCVVTDAWGNTATSSTVTIGFDCPEGYEGPGVTVNADDIHTDVDAGEYASVTVTAAGPNGDAEGLSYQWYLRADENAPWSRSSLKGDTYSVRMIPSKSGRQVRCVVTDKYGRTVTSDAATLTMAP